MTSDVRVCRGPGSSHAGLKAAPDSDRSHPPTRMHPVGLTKTSWVCPICRQKYVVCAGFVGVRA